MLIPRPGFVQKADERLHRRETGSMERGESCPFYVGGAEGRAVVYGSSWCAGYWGRVRCEVAMGPDGPGTRGPNKLELGGKRYLAYIQNKKPAPPTHHVARGLPRVSRCGFQISKGREEE